MHSVFADKHGTRIIDLSAQNERQAVIRPCVWCSRDVAVAADFQGQVFCSDKCAKEAASVGDSLRDTLGKFADATPEFYRCPYNTQKLVEAFQSQRFTDWTVRGLKAAFQTLFAENQLLQKLTLKEIQEASPGEYATRLRLDPEMGGWREKIDNGEVLTRGNQRRPVESATPGFIPSDRVQQMQRMAERERNAVVQSRANNRYKSEAFVNGEPVSAPQLQQGLAHYRNGRRAG